LYKKDHWSIRQISRELENGALTKEERSEVVDMVRWLTQRHDYGARRPRATSAVDHGASRHLMESRIEISISSSAAAVDGLRESASADGGDPNAQQQN